MISRSTAPYGSRAFCGVAVLASTLLLAPAPSSAAEPSLAAPLCGVLKKLLPEVRTYKPEGARAQLVMEIAEKFENDAATLRQVRAEIDRATTAGCPREREAMLGVLKMKSLAEAVS